MPRSGAPADADTAMLQQSQKAEPQTTIPFPSWVQQPAASRTDVESLSHFSEYSIAVLSTVGKSKMFSPIPLFIY